MTFAATVCVGVTAFGTGFDRKQFEAIPEMHPFGEKAQAVVVGDANGDGIPDVADVPKVRFSATFKLTIIRHDDVAGDKCAIDDTRDPEWHAYLGMGDSIGNLSVKQIDLDGGKVLLSMVGYEDEWLELGSTGAAATPVRAPGFSNRPSGGAGPRSYHGRGSHSTPSATDSVAPPAPKPEPPKQTMSAEAMENYLQEYQKNIIRSQGELGPPLPVVLSQESDDELVREGTLPAQ